MALQTIPGIEPDAAGRDGLGARRWSVVLVLATVAVLAVGANPLLIGALAIATVTPELVRVDLESSRLPNRLVLPCYPAVLAGIAADGILNDATPTGALFTGAVWFGFFLLLNLGGGMGMGDVKLAGVLGLCLGSLGVVHAVMAIMVAFAAGGIAGAVVLARRVGGRRSRIPFGPFLLAGFWIALALTPTLGSMTTGSTP